MKIIILRALHLGDMLCLIPAVRALRAAQPKAFITLIGLPWAGRWAERYPRYFDSFLEFPGYPGLPERPFDPVRFLRFLESVQALKADLALQMHGSGVITNPLVGLFGAERVGGLFMPGHYQPDPQTFVPCIDDEHEILRLLRVVQALGIGSSQTDLEFPLLEADGKSLERRSWFSGIHKESYVCIHPGARSRHKCWPPSHFARVADTLADEGFHIVLSGSKNEQDLTQAVQAAMRHQAIDTAADHLPLGELAMLMHRSRLLVSNDTGVSHLAAALRLPSVIVFSETKPRRWAPLDSKRHIAVAHPEEISPQRVAAHALGLLRDNVYGDRPNLTDL